ncbi:MAG: hypothetical protein JWQ14_1026 [Adhaeribacter sp.]|nr:hypothetical protein [Adhaeribacter sp.]
MLLLLKMLFLTSNHELKRLIVYLNEPTNIFSGYAGCRKINGRP